jgi:hypothetical protein
MIRKKCQSDFSGKGQTMTEGLNLKRTGKKLGLLLAGMVVFLVISMWIKGMEFKIRVFMALFAGLSAWMGIISLAIWLWKETNQEGSESESLN